MATPDQINKYYDNISADPARTPTAGSLVSSSVSGTYTFYQGANDVNEQQTSTGLYDHYIGGNTILTASEIVDLQDIIQDVQDIIQSVRATFPQLTSNDVQAFFNSLTTANANALQYVSSGTPSANVTGAQTASSAVVNQGVLSNSTGSTLPTSFDGLIQAIVNYFKPTKGVMTPVTSGGKTLLYNQLLDFFKQSTQAITDLDFLSVPIEDQFNNAFSAFLKYFPSQQLEKVTSTGLYNYITPNDFFRTWLNFTAATSTVQASTQDDALPFTVLNIPFIGSLTVPNFASDPDANAYVLNYEAIYKAFFPNNTSADFQAFFKDFYNKIISDPANGGYFLPSHFVGDFFDAVKAKYLIPFRKQNSGFDLEKPTLSIIWEVLARIKQMVDIVQQLSVYVSQRLTFLTNYQKAYTNLIATIPTVTANDPIIGSDATSKNAQLNNYRTTLASYRDQITAASKGVQSYLDTLSQASSNSLNQGGALITMMNGLLTILRS